MTFLMRSNDSKSQFEFEFGAHRLYFSYNTCVMLVIDCTVIVLDDMISKTTSRHVNQWLRGYEILNENSDFWSIYKVDQVTFSSILHHVQQRMCAGFTQDFVTEIKALCGDKQAQQQVL